VGEVIGEVPVSDYIDKTVVARAQVTSAAVEAFDPDQPVEREVRLNRSIKAPVSSGTVVGTLAYSQGDKPICQVPIVAAASVEAPGPLERLGIWLMRAARGLVGAPSMASAVAEGS
jgi:hypothetical protein